MAISYKWLYDQLLPTTIRRTASISTKHTLRLPEGHRSIHTNDGFIHSRLVEDKWEILVPQHKTDRELCYMKYFPETLAKLLKIDHSATEVIGQVLRSSLLIMDNLLDISGIGTFSKIPAPPRIVTNVHGESSDIEATGLETTLARLCGRLTSINDCVNTK